MKISIYILVISLFLLINCTDSSNNENRSAQKTLGDFFNYSGQESELTGGIKLISVTTPKGNFNVWTKRVGNNPEIKVLLLHGGPGFTHEYLECFDSYFPKAGIEYYYYDQLGSYDSDQPSDSSL